MSKFVNLLFFLILFGNVNAQQVFIDGTVSGYTYNPSNGLFSKGGNVSLEGSLGGVKIEVIKNGKTLKNVTSTNSGDFSLELPFGATYQIHYSKIGYETVRFQFNLTNLNETSENLTFKNFELILNKHIQYKDNVEPGLAFEIFYDTKMLNFDLEEKGFKTGGAISKKMDYDPLISLVKGSIKKNEPYLFANNKVDKTKSKSNKKKTGNAKSDHVNADTAILSIEKSEISDSKSSISILNKLKKSTTLNSKESLIDELKKQLEQDKMKASSPEDFAMIEEKEALILALSSELDLTKEVIAFKEEQLSIKSKQFWLLMLVFLLVVGAGVYVYLSMRKKEQLNLKVISQGKRIVSSIAYAEKIQTALLPTIQEVVSIVPNSFVLFKPKDLVSGDFYWVKEIDGKIVIAAIDCTGHGVPGAFMSMIGMTLFNQIVLIEKNLDPGSILTNLHRSIVSSLKQDNSDPFSSQDGMDLSVAVYDKATCVLTYAGAMNSIFMVTNGSVKELEVDKRSIGGFTFRNTDFTFTNRTINIENGHSLYFMSDGFMDQFGGAENEKFNITRLHKLLLDIQKDSMSSQKLKIEKSLEDWQGARPQTDDILFMGVLLRD